MGVCVCMVVGVDLIIIIVIIVIISADWRPRRDIGLLQRYVFQYALATQELFGPISAISSTSNVPAHCHRSLTILSATSVALVLLRTSSSLFRSHTETPSMALSIALWVTPRLHTTFNSNILIIFLMYIADWRIIKIVRHSGATCVGDFTLYRIILNLLR